jgi:hypothetical protein
MSVFPSEVQIDVPHEVNFTGSVLIASSAAASCRAAVKRSATANSIADERDLLTGAPSNLTGPIKDVADMYAFLRKHRVTVDNLFMDVRDASRELVLHAIAALCSQRQRCILYYSGHGKAKTGDWCFQGEFITLDDILSEWQRRPNGNRQQVLVIVADCCFSGAWVKALQRRCVRNVFMQASCGADELAAETPEGGAFTRFWLDRLTVLHAPSVRRSPVRLLRFACTYLRYSLLGHASLLPVSHPLCYDPQEAAFKQRYRASRYYYSDSEQRMFQRYWVQVIHDFPTQPIHKDSEYLMLLFLASPC